MTTEISVLEAFYGTHCVTDTVNYFARAGRPLEVSDRVFHVRDSFDKDMHLLLRLSNGEEHVAQKGEMVEFFPRDPTPSSEILLTIAVCSVPERLGRFSTIQQLCQQAEGLTHVEVLYLGDNRRMSIGCKRNTLVGLGRGKYFCFVDDDDRVSDTFIDTILDSLYASETAGRDTDCFTYQVSVEWTVDKFTKTRRVCYYSQHYCDVNEPDRFLRLPNHLMVWKRSKMVSFEANSSYAEDFNFAREMKKMGYTEEAIPEVLYHYEITEDSVSGPVFLASCRRSNSN